MLNKYVEQILEKVTKEKVTEDPSLLETMYENISKIADAIQRDLTQTNITVTIDTAKPKKTVQKNSRNQGNRKPLSLNMNEKSIDNSLKKMNRNKYNYINSMN